VRAGATSGRGVEVGRVSTRDYLTAGVVALLLAISLSIAAGVSAVGERLTSQGVATTEGREVTSVRTSSGYDSWHDGIILPVPPHAVDHWFDEPETMR
jgi:hypothetical protein